MLLLSLLFICALSFVSGAVPLGYGIGCYNDTNPSPPISLQLPCAANLTGAGGWALLFFESLDPADESTLLPQAWQLSALTQAYALQLVPVVRLGLRQRNYRYFSDDPQHLQYTSLGEFFSRFVAALPLPPDASSSLRIVLGNEPNICGEWTCNETHGSVSMTTVSSEFAGFAKDVTAALSKLPRLRLGLAGLGTIGAESCTCDWPANSTGAENATYFVQRMISSVPSVFGNVTDFYAHPYPACQEPFGSWCARGWLAAYRDAYEPARDAWAPFQAPGSRFPIVISETGWQSPNNETGKAAWMLEALQELWAPDADVDAVLPFLLAGGFWDPLGFPWTLWNGSTLTTLQPQYLAVQALARG
jgi:hypothetical protein